MLGSNPGPLQLVHISTSSPSAFLRRRLVSEVSIVFHSAATVKFDEELTKSVAMNVGAVLSIVNLCKKMPNLEVQLVVARCREMALSSEFHLFSCAVINCAWYFNNCFQKCNNFAVTGRH
jgi:hypothetical protein